VLYRYVPETLIERPKMGFGIPLGSWLRGPLREWAEALLDPAAIRAYGLIDPEPVQQKWREHVSGRADWNYHLWAVLMLQVWLVAGR
jgi:asparagine synthase (glutamine-hydrolysing)